MDTKLRGMLIGMTLGDGYIDHRISTRATFKVEHSIDQRDYAQLKLDKLRSIFGGWGELRFRDRFDKRTGKVYSSCMFAVGNEVFKTIHSYVYHEGRKQYRREMLDMLTPEGIAYWYMDDGYAKQVFKKGTNLITSAYSMLYTYCSEEEGDIIIGYFLETWKIRALKYRMYGDKWAIKFNTSESKKLVALIMDYVPDCMIYKISHVSSQLFQECLPSQVRCTICNAPTRNKSTSICQSCAQTDEGRKLKAMMR
jgi:hypothetical protein